MGEMGFSAQGVLSRVLMDSTELLLIAPFSRTLSFSRNSPFQLILSPRLGSWLQAACFHAGFLHPLSRDGPRRPRWAKTEET